MGNGLHTVEDLFAHSNFVEIAVGSLITAGRITVSAELQAELAKRAATRPVETLAGQDREGPADPHHGSYVASDTLVSLSEAADRLHGGVRPVRSPPTRSARRR